MGVSFGCEERKETEESGQGEDDVRGIVSQPSSPLFNENSHEDDDELRDA